MLKIREHVFSMQTLSYGAFFVLLPKIIFFLKSRFFEDLVLN
jgi:hypothetical protein